ncbi:MAG: efflux RND transporter permease subunit, partial [Bacteroidota bacterium]
MKSLINFFARQGLFSELLTILVIGYGLFALSSIKRETFPNVQYDVITIYTLYPGAAPSEVEKLITNPIEQALKEVDGIKKKISVSTEGRSGVFLILDPDETTQAEAKVDVQDVIDKIRDFPDLEEDPDVTALESKIFPVVEVAVSGGRNPFHRKETARWLEKEIEKLPQVAKVDLQGERQYEIRVEISGKKLRAYQLSLAEVINALREQNVSIPGGTFTQAFSGIEKDVIVRTEGQFEDVEDVKNTVLRSNDLGRPILLSDIANVFLSLKKASTAYRVNGKESIRLVVSKKEKADAIDLIDDLKVMISAVDKSQLQDIEIEYINDLSILIRRRLGVLSNNLLVGLILVVLVLSVFLPVRVSLVTAIGIPFSFLGCIAYFYLAGISLNLITMMGLIIVIGMLVDDAVVVTENAVRRMENGEAPMDAAIRGTQQIWRPVFASVMTTILAFYPMTIMTGIFGKFVAFIPLGVICALLVSLFECYFVLPYHIGRWISEGDARAPTSGFKYYFEKVWNFYLELYGNIVAVVARWRYLFAVFFVGLIGL